jgi:hypothetical protein
MPDPAPIASPRIEVAPPSRPPPAEAQALPPAAAPALPPAAAPAGEMPLPSMLRLARAAAAEGVATLHLLVPRRASVLGQAPLPALAAIEAAAAAEPALALGWVPLRHAFGRLPNPGTLWRRDGARLAVDGGVALVGTLLAVLRALSPGGEAALARAAALLARAELGALPRREVAGQPQAAEGEAFLGVAVREMEPALTADIFFDLPPPRPFGDPLPGLQAWASAGAPLPWRVLLLAEPGLGGIEGPAMLGWWLRHLAAECVLSEALLSAPAEAVLAARPDLVLTLAAEPDTG